MLSVETYVCHIGIFCNISIFLPQILQKKKTDQRFLLFWALSYDPPKVRYVIYPFPEKVLQPCLP